MDCGSLSHSSTSKILADQLGKLKLHGVHLGFEICQEEIPVFLGGHGCVLVEVFGDLS
jgi:hypothetical protein